MLPKTTEVTLPKAQNLENVQEADIQTDVLIRGKLMHMHKKNEERLIYQILKSKRYILCYKDETFHKVYRKFNLKQVKISIDHEFINMTYLDDETPEDNTNLKIILKSRKVITLLEVEPEKRQELVKFLEACKSPVSPSKSFLKNLKVGAMRLIKAPVTISSGTIHVLEKIGDGARKAPDVIFSRKDIKNKTRKIPRDPAQGLLYGAESIITEVAGAIIGLVAEPMKGAKKRGIKGATTGLGKGIVGLIFKPVAGTIDLVTNTARGVGTVPGVIYRNVFKIKPKKKEAEVAEKDKEIIKSGMELVFEDEKKEIYVNVKSLEKELLKSGGLDAPEEEEKSSNYKEKYKVEKEKREHLTKIMADIIKNLDEESKNKNKMLISEALEFSGMEDPEKENINTEEEFSRIIDYYEGQPEQNQETREELYEFFLIKALPVNEAGNEDLPSSSFQTASFQDRPNEKDFVVEEEKICEYSDHSSSFSAAYSSDHVVNKNICGYDSEEFDGDEFEFDEDRIAYSLAMHTGREGRNGPKLYAFGMEQKIPREQNGERILIFSHEEAINSMILAENLNNSKDDIVVFKEEPVEVQIKQVKTDPPVDLRPINYSNLNELIDLEFKIKELNKWHYPEVKVDLPYQEIPDVPNIIRIQDYETLKKEYCHLKGKELIRFLENWKFIESKDDIRYPFAYKKGGKTAENEFVVKKIRTIAKEFIMKVGRTVLSGNFNLTSIPMPIKASIPRSYLENVGSTPSCFFPLYLNLAMKDTDPLQRFKFYMISMLSYYCYTLPFAKPLNPIIGETFTGHYPDGGRAYLEQISHHPPISYLLYLGPKDAYRVWGPSMFAASAGLNSLNLTTKALRKIQFADTKQTISNTFPNEHYEGSFWGTLFTETIGDMEFVDHGNKIYCKISFGSVKKKPSDYFQGTIMMNGKSVSTISGTYLGWIDIDGFRYFDYRYSHPFHIEEERSPLPSDFHYRKDYISLKFGHIDKAQKEKDALEQIQRNDSKLRKAKHEKEGNNKHK